MSRSRVTCATAMSHAERETWRVFAALPVAEHIKDGIERVQTQLRRAVTASTCRWVAREQWHLTIKFLGDVDVGRIEALVASVHAACTGRGVLRLRAGDVGFFPKSRR